MINYGLTGPEVLSEVRSIVHREYNDPRLAVALADADYRTGHGNSEYIQIGSFATQIRWCFT